MLCEGRGHLLPPKLHWLCKREGGSTPSWPEQAGAARGVSAVHPAHLDWGLLYAWWDNGTFYVAGMLQGSEKNYMYEEKNSLIFIAMFKKFFWSFTVNFLNIYIVRRLSHMEDKFPKLLHFSFRILGFQNVPKRLSH